MLARWYGGLPQRRPSDCFAACLFEARVSGRTCAERAATACIRARDTARKFSAASGARGTNPSFAGAPRREEGRKPESGTVCGAKNGAGGGGNTRDGKSGTVQGARLGERVADRSVCGTRTAAASGDAERAARNLSGSDAGHAGSVYEADVRGGDRPGARGAVAMGRRVGRVYGAIRVARGAVHHGQHTRVSRQCGAEV